MTEGHRMDRFDGIKPQSPPVLCDRIPEIKFSVEKEGNICYTMVKRGFTIIGPWMRRAWPSVSFQMLLIRSSNNVLAGKV